MSKKNITTELIEFDKSFGCMVAGCDEAGRGPLAGPVVCAACIMPLDNIVDGVNDSKQISEKKRESLYAQIIERATRYQIAIIDCETIDKINILNATKRGMTDAINGLFGAVRGNLTQQPACGESGVELSAGLPAELVLVDAVSLAVDCKTMPIIKGDAKSYNIAAASIIAKVTRDRIMREQDERFPGYGFVSNKGYGTAEHIEALKEKGACSLHRKTFIKNFVKTDLSNNENEISQNSRLHYNVK